MFLWARAMHALQASNPLTVDHSRCRRVSWVALLLATTFSRCADGIGTWLLGSLLPLSCGSCCGSSYGLWASASGAYGLGPRRSTQPTCASPGRTKMLLATPGSFSRSNCSRDSCCRWSNIQCLPALNHGEVGDLEAARDESTRAAAHTPVGIRRDVVPRGRRDGRRADHSCSWSLATVAGLPGNRLVARPLPTGVSRVDAPTAKWSVAGLFWSIPLFPIRDVVRCTRRSDRTRRPLAMVPSQVTSPPVPAAWQLYQV